MIKPPIYPELLLGLSLLSCASQKSVQAPEPETSPQASNAPIDEPTIAEDEAELMKQIEAEAALADADSSGNAGPAEDGPREVVYRVSSDSLKIQVAGAEFYPQAEMIRIAGGYGVKVSVEATASVPLVLLAPKGGPLAFSGSVRGSTNRKFGDTRDGQDEMSLTPNVPITFERTWPAPGQPPLAQGQQLELEVGLWSLGPDAASRRPVRKFFVVKLRGEAKGRAVVEAPSR